jgi:hypothetical protein
MSFSTKNKIRLTKTVNITMLLIALLITLYYWTNSTLLAMRKVPLALMLLVLVYVILHMVKRRLNQHHHWTHWIHYLGLTALIYPILLGTDENIGSLNLITDIGVLFLIIPILLELRQQKSNEDQKI